MIHTSAPAPRSSSLGSRPSTRVLCARTVELPSRLMSVHACALHPHRGAPVHCAEGARVHCAEGAKPSLVSVAMCVQFFHRGSSRKTAWCIQLPASVDSVCRTSKVSCVTSLGLAYSRCSSQPRSLLWMKSERNEGNPFPESPTGIRKHLARAFTVLELS